MLVCMKIQHSGGVSRLIQHSASPRAVLASRHTPSCCIFHTHARRCFNYNIKGKVVFQVYASNLCILWNAVSHNLKTCLLTHCENIMFFLSLSFSYFFDISQIFSAIYLSVCAYLLIVYICRCTRGRVTGYTYLTTH